MISYLFPRLSESKKNTFVQFIKFGIVGVSNTVLSYVLYLLVILSFKRTDYRYDYVIANLVSFFLSVLWSFYWNNKYVFTIKAGQKRNVFLALLKTYLSYAFTGILLTNVLSFVWIDVLESEKK